MRHHASFLLCVFMFVCKMGIFQVPVQMMYMKKNVAVYYDQAINTSVLHLPFNSSYSMLLMLPEYMENMETLENAICPGRLTKWLKWMKTRLGKSNIILKSLYISWPNDFKCHWHRKRLTLRPFFIKIFNVLFSLSNTFCLLRLTSVYFLSDKSWVSDQSMHIVYVFIFRRYEIYVPKFSIKTSYKLNDVLAEMGMTDMFSERANLGGIAPGQRLAVSEVNTESFLHCISHTLPFLYSIYHFIPCCLH